MLTYVNQPTSKTRMQKYVISCTSMRNTISLIKSPILVIWTPSTTSPIFPSAQNQNTKSFKLKKFYNQPLIISKFSQTKQVLYNQPLIY